MLTELGVRKLVKRVCAEIDPERPAPEVFFIFHNFTFLNGVKRGAPVARYQPDHRRILLPNQKWIKKYKATTDLGYRLLVLHELAHHLFASDHGADFYSGLFGLCDLYGVRHSFAVADELTLHPRGAAQGLDKYHQSLQDKINALVEGQ